MSLTYLLKHDSPLRRTVDACLRPVPQQQLPQPRNATISTASTAQASLAGTTFDMLLKTVLERDVRQRNLTAFVSPWAAAQFEEIAPELLRETRKHAQNFVLTGENLEELTLHLTALAPLENAAHGGPLPKRTFSHPGTAKIALSWLNAVPKELRPKDTLIVAPHFGPASIALGGAEADLIIDQMLVDIKAGERQRVTLADRRQLVAYWLCADACGIWTKQEHHTPTLTHAGIYFAQSGTLIRLAKDDLIKPETWDNAIQRFQNEYLPEQQSKEC